MENEDNKQKGTKKVYQKWWFWVIVVVIIIGTFGSSNTTNTVDTSKSKTNPVQANETQLDNCGADWNEQAAKSAKSYLDFSSFSRSGLIKQLEYEGFTAEQAEYGATAVGY